MSVQPSDITMSWGLTMLARTWLSLAQKRTKHKTKDELNTCLACSGTAGRLIRHDGQQNTLQQPSSCSAARRSCLAGSRVVTHVLSKSTSSSEGCQRHPTACSALQHQSCAGVGDQVQTQHLLRDRDLLHLQGPRLGQGVCTQIKPGQVPLQAATWCLAASGGPECPRPQSPL